MHVTVFSTLNLDWQLYSAAVSGVTRTMAQT